MGVIRRQAASPSVAEETALGITSQRTRTGLPRTEHTTPLGETALPSSRERRAREIYAGINILSGCSALPGGTSFKLMLAKPLCLRPLPKIRPREKTQPTSQPH